MRRIFPPGRPGTAIRVLFVLTGILSLTGWYRSGSGATDPLIAPLPDLLVTSGGIPVESAEAWERIRRKEILELFRDHVYGRVPDREAEIHFEEAVPATDALGGLAVRKEVDVVVSLDGDTLTMGLLLYLPAARSGPVPVFLGLNFYGNHTIHPDEGIRITDSWMENNKAFGITENRATPESRGVRAHRWPVEMILSRGYGLATMCYHDIDPDFDDGFRNGIHAILGPEPAGRDSADWGAIAAWARGLSAAMDYLETDPSVDPGRVAVIGHSRLGKAALWAGAQDERFSLVVSNNSGCGGAALSRRAFGERVADINTTFPHWFAARFHAYNDREAALPVDQHMLLALIAPRPLYVASAENDDWADPPGEYLSLYHAGEVYSLYGEKILKVQALPAVDRPVRSGKLGYHIRSGDHDLTVYDWEQYLDFADLHMSGFENPVTPEWIMEHLRDSAPRLILTPELETRLREGMQKDPLTRNGYHLLEQVAASMLETEPLTYSKTGRRLLGVSREAIRRMTTLALVYRMKQDTRYLQRLEQEMEAVCMFPDWNPSHFLDVAEMATAVALAVDWAGEWFHPELDNLARASLVEKALKPGMPGAGDHFWVDVHHNWNLVCHGGLSLAALAVFEEEPGLAAAILHRAVEKIPLGLEPYAPDGVYPEGPSYWFYATDYLTATISAFRSALGTDFGFGDAPGLKKSAMFSRVLAGPSGQYFNYFDAGLEGYQSLSHHGLLSWFAANTGIEMDTEAYGALLSKESEQPGQVLHNRFFSLYLLHSVLLNQTHNARFVPPEVWTGRGDEPICILRDPEGGKDAFFLAAKGGRAADNHGNMDAGSFVFELNGVRWSVDPGNQNYNELEQIMGNELWNQAQDSRRWSLLTKNNFGHSTLTLNGELHLADARATMTGMGQDGDVPRVTFDLTPVFGGSARQVLRTFSKVSDETLRVSDLLSFSPETRTITWQLVTAAELECGSERMYLRQEGKTLVLQVTSHAPFRAGVVPLSPPPLSCDKDIPGLKRLEIQFDRNDFPGDSGEIVVELSGMAGSHSFKKPTSDI